MYHALNSFLLSLTLTVTACGEAGTPGDAPGTGPASPSAAAPAATSPAATDLRLDAPIPSIRLSKVFANDTWVRPTQIVPRPDHANELVVIEQGGRMRTVRHGSPEAPAVPFMDLSDRVSFTTNEEGLLSLAFHPRFAENRHFFVYYSAKNPRRTVLSRFTAKPAPDDPSRLVGDPASEEVLLTIDQPYWNHNGGTVLFGPDGMLYLSIGDGGAANDPHGHGQNLETLLATIIRIDVDRTADGKPYAVPDDNPFLNRAGARPEIWAYGLRNVWRMSFDPVTGTLWAGDVGQNAWEEIDRIVRGGNYGWNKREGKHPFPPGSRETTEGMIDPVVDYPRRDGISVTGGEVYRGTQFPGLNGVYLYADYAYGTIWGFRFDETSISTPKQVYQKRGRLISSFGRANDGELYVTVFEGGERGPGAIYRITQD